MNEQQREDLRRIAAQNHARRKAEEAARNTPDPVKESRARLRGGLFALEISLAGLAYAGIERTTAAVTALADQLRQKGDGDAEA